MITRLMTAEELSKTILFSDFTRLNCPGAMRYANADYTIIISLTDGDRYEVVYL